MTAELCARLRDADEQNALIVRRRAANVIEKYGEVLDEIRGAYDDYYSGGNLTRLLNAEKLVRDVRYGR